MPFSFALLLTPLALAANPAGPTPDLDAAARTFRETLGALIKADTTNLPGNEARAVAIIAERLKAAGIPYEVTEFAPGRQNIVARLKGTGAEKPLMLLAHTDVVGTKDQTWTSPPHEMTERDGYLYGRGVHDDLAMAVGNLEIFLALKQTGTPLRRDVILALTGDEESGGDGINYLIREKPQQIDAEIVLNEGGEPALIEEAGGAAPKPGEKLPVRYLRFQAAEKTYQDFVLTAHGTTGHSSVPRSDNAIYAVARALDRLAKNPPAPRFIPVTRAFFEGVAKFEGPETAKAMRALVAADAARKPLPKAALDRVARNPVLYASLITTCVATTINGGTRVNALPAEARANVNCRMLPDETTEGVRERLAKIFGDAAVEVTLGSHFGRSDASPMAGEVPAALRAVAAELFPGVPVLPYLMAGATDSRFLRPRGAAAYGFSPFAMAESDTIRAHGVDERLAIASIRPGLEFWWRLVNRLAAAKPSP